MPGVTCTHYARNGAPAEGCHGHLPINSIRIGTGQSCTFYRGADCTGGGLNQFTNVNRCVAGNVEWKSFKCVSLPPLRRNMLSLFLASLFDPWNAGDQSTLS